MSYLCSQEETVNGSEKWTIDRINPASASVQLWIPTKILEKVAVQAIGRPHPVFSFLHVRSVSLSGAVGVGTGDAPMRHDHALCDVQYAPPEEEFSETVDNAAQMITLPKWRFRWSNGRMLADGEEPSRLVRTQKITRSYKYFPIMPAWCYTNVGKVNANYITLGGHTCPPETVLFEGATASRRVNPAGTWGWEVNGKWTFNPNGWNRWFNTIAGQWLEFMTWNAATSQWTVFKMYELAEF